MRNLFFPRLGVCAFLAFWLTLLSISYASAREGEVEILLSHPDGAPAWIVGELGTVPLPRQGHDDSDAYFEELYGNLEPSIRDLAAEYLGASGEENFFLDSFHVDWAEDRSQVAHLSFRQTLWRLPVAGSGFRIRVSLEDGRILGFNGRLHPWQEEQDPERQEVMAFDDALVRALVGMEMEGEAVGSETLLFLGTRTGPRLAYQAKVKLGSSFGPDILTIDAIDGTLLESVPTLLPGPPPGPGDTGPSYPTQKQRFRTHTGSAMMSTPPYDFWKLCENTLSFPLPGFLSTPQPPCSYDASVSRAHDYAIDVFAYYKIKHGRASYDGAYAPLVSVANLLVQDTFGNWGPMANAYWDSQAHRMYYGDGDGNYLLDLTLGFDVAAHELTHGVTQETSNLIYNRESGALNEAMSDIFAAAAEAWRDGAITVDTWRIGEDVAGPALGAALRYMNNPTLDGYSPDYYPEKLYPDPCTPSQSNDYCGVHGNSGIANLAFQLLVEGGSHPQGKTSTVVSGIGMEKAAAIFYGAQFLLNPSDGFAAIRVATEQVATTLYGSAEAASVLDSWTAVGVVP